MLLNWLNRYRNILPDETPPVWNPSNVADSLQEIRKYVEIEAGKAINWYFKNKASKALLSRWLRFLAITLSSIAGVLPIVLSVFHDNTSGIQSGLFVSLLLGVAAALVGLDHFFGFSSGWIRYVITATAMQAALEEFRMDWQLLSAHLSMPPSNDQVLALLERAKSFRASIAGMVLDETKSWAAEFQTNMSQLEKNVKAEFEEQRAKLQEDLKMQKATTKTGGIEVKVSNAMTLDGRSFAIWLEGTGAQHPPEVVVGSTLWSIVNIVPGQYKMIVKGRRSGAEVMASRIVKVTPDEAVSVEVELPLSPPVG